MNHPIAIWLKGHVFGITITLLIIIIGVMIFSEGNDTPPILYASQDTSLKVTEGKTLLTREGTQILKAGASINLQVNDRIKTFPNSRATIFWADGSVTRLSEKTTITITSLQVSQDLSSVQIRFETESGKTWSNVIRSLLPDSFFEQSYDNGTYVATVRGTIFEVNLDKDYAHAVKHSISIRNTKKNTETDILQGKTVKTRSWQEIGKEALDTAWEKWNTDEDVTYINSQINALSDRLFQYTQQNKGVQSWTKKLGKLLRKETSIDAIMSESILEKNADKIEVLKATVANAKSPEEKAVIHAKLLAYHQATNILPENESTLALRDTLRDLIIETTPDEQKTKLRETFTQVTFNDYVDALTSGSKTQAEKLKKKLQKAIEDKVQLPGLEEFQSRASKIINTEKVQSALEGVKQEGTKIINQASEVLINEQTKNAIGGVKDEAVNLFNGIKNVVQ